MLYIASHCGIVVRDTAYDIRLAVPLCELQRVVLCRHCHL